MKLESNIKTKEEAEEFFKKKFGFYPEDFEKISNGTSLDTNTLITFAIEFANIKNESQN